MYILGSVPELARMKMLWYLMYNNIHGTGFLVSIASFLERHEACGKWKSNTSDAISWMSDTGAFHLGFVRIS